MKVEDKQRLEKVEMIIRCMCEVMLTDMKASEKLGQSLSKCMIGEKSCMAIAQVSQVSEK